MLRYTAKNSNSYGEFYEDEKLKYIFSDLAEATFVTEFGNKKQDTIDAQNARADAMNKRNSEIEAELRYLKTAASSLAIEYQRVINMLDRAMKFVRQSDDEELCYKYKAWCNENLAETYSKIELAPPVQEVVAIDED